MFRSADIDTEKRTIAYRGFIIQEAYDPKSCSNRWEWAQDRVPSTASGLADDLFQCFPAIDQWHEQREAA